MSFPVRYERNGDLGSIELDDGKVNALNPDTFDALLAAFDKAERDGARAIVLSGNERYFSPGLDLKNLASFSPERLASIVTQLREVALRIFTSRRPVIAAVTGHAVGGGAVMAAACDRAIGRTDGMKVGLNEAAIGLPLPFYIVELALTRLAPSFVGRSLTHGEIFDPKTALQAGLVEQLVEPAQVRARAFEIAQIAAMLSDDAYWITKQRVRGDAWERIEQHKTADTKALGDA